MIQMDQLFLSWTDIEGTLAHLWSEAAILHEQTTHLLSAEAITVRFMLDESHICACSQVTP